VTRGKTPLFLRVWVAWALFVLASIVQYNWGKAGDDSPFISILVGFGGSMSIYLPLLLWQRHRARMLD
jgi:hypothetical protein